MTQSLNGIAARLSTKLARAEQRTPRILTTCIMVVASLGFIAHYSFGEWVFNPDIAFWKERPFLFEMLPYLGIGPGLWCWWTVVSLANLKPARLIMGMAIALLAGDVIFYIVPSILKTIEQLGYFHFHSSIEKWLWHTYTYWDVWVFWLPVVLSAGNAVLAWHWWSKFGATFLPKKGSVSIGYGGWKARLIRSMAIITSSGAILIAGLHLVLPAMVPSPTTLWLAKHIFLRRSLEHDLDFLVSDPNHRYRSLKTLLAHVELADLQRTAFYSHLETEVFQDYILSPQIEDGLVVDESDWRRELWENFWPKVRHESDPWSAAKAIAASLRARVGIDATYSYRVGVETIWTEQMADENGFNRVYVAALRSVGVAARLNRNGRAEVFYQARWKPAPNPDVISF